MNEYKVLTERQEDNEKIINELQSEIEEMQKDILVKFDEIRLITQDNFRIEREKRKLIATKVCRVCGGKIYAKGLCRNCYTKLRRKTVLTEIAYIKKNTRTLEEKLNDKLQSRKDKVNDDIRDRIGKSIDFLSLVSENEKNFRDQEKTVINEYFYNGKTYQEISEVLGVSRQRVEQIIKYVKTKAIKIYRENEQKKKSEADEVITEIGTYDNKGYAKDDVIKPKKTKTLVNGCESTLDAGLSVRAYNALGRMGIKTIGEAYEAYLNEELPKIRNLGKKTYDEIVSKFVFSEVEWNDK